MNNKNTGCPNCDDFPDFPANHCGKPGCRDAQLLMYAEEEGLDPASVLTIGTRGAAESAGICSTCALSSVCVVGLAIQTTVESLCVQVATCEGYKDLESPT